MTITIQLLLLFLISSLSNPCHVLSFSFPKVSNPHLKVRKADKGSQLSRLFSLEDPLQNQVEGDNSLVHLSGNYNATNGISITTQDNDIYIHPLKALERDVSFVIHNLTASYDNSIYPCK